MKEHDRLHYLRYLQEAQWRRVDRLKRRPQLTKREKNDLDETVRNLIAVEEELRQYDSTRTKPD